MVVIELPAITSAAATLLDCCNGITLDSGEIVHVGQPAKAAPEHKDEDHHPTHADSEPVPQGFL
jgi:hypothetical protein